jgi:transposase InsO family protein
VKYASIEAQRTHYPIELMCRVLQVSRSGFFAWGARREQAPPDADAQVREDLREAHRQSRRLYGRRRLTKALRRRGHCINPKRVRRLMREEGLRGVRKGRFVPRTTDSQHSLTIAENVLARRFDVQAGADGWVSDITYVPTREGWLYLAIIIALRTRQVLGYSLAEHMPDELVLNALRNACHVQPPAPSTLFHSDRGSQYASDDFRAAIGALAMVASMSRKGNCWDNAVAESFFATLKVELDHDGAWRTRADAHRAVFDYIELFYNADRRHSTLGYLSPLAFERQWQSA